jgi:NADPH:quinone reductase-like Zn-dependent oxidoreductase
MRAIIWTNYGPPNVLQLQEIEKPAPKENEVLIRIHATTVTMGDCELRGARFPVWLWLPIRLWLGVLKPRKRILGQELAGEVEAVGSAVTRFEPGDAVMAFTGFNLGAYAEYICLPETRGFAMLAAKPASVTYEEAAAIPVGGMEAWTFLQRGSIRRGEKVLINGAGGSIGTIAVQLAKNDGAEVTAVDSTPKLDMLRSLGADHVIDYAQEDFTQNGQTYDVIFDVVGKTRFSRTLASLKPRGRYLIGNPQLRHMMGRKSWPDGRTVIAGASGQSREDLVSIKKLIEAGKLKVVIDKRYPLEEMVEAHRYVESGQKQGNVVITVA